MNFPLNTPATMLSMEDDWADSCYTIKTKESGKFASICDIISISDLMSMDFSDTAKCNFYLTDDKFAMTPSVMAIQVWVDFFVNKVHKSRILNEYICPQIII